jgi:uncharacterized protein (TIGR00661 family)
LSNRKNILICPLEWGLGHAGRMIRVARELQTLNHNVLFGSGEEQLTFVKGELHGITCIQFPGFRIKYSRYFPQYIIILLNFPVLIFHIIREHSNLKKIIKKYSIDIVISDNRIGLWNSGIKSVFVTHQLRIPFPWPFRFLEFTGVLINRLIIKNYSYCFIPDLAGELNVSGKLSHEVKLLDNVRYIGILSRLKDQIIISSNPYSEKCLVMLSGPEPQRTILKQKLTETFLSSGKPTIILEGRPGIEEESYTDRNIHYYNHLKQEETIQLLKQCETVITRSGYTTIMELISLGKSALLIPTPGQTEQEYLAEYLTRKGWFMSIRQKELDKNTEICATSAHIPASIIAESNALLKNALKELLEE